MRLCRITDRPDCSARCLPMLRCSAATTQSSRMRRAWRQASANLRAESVDRCRRKPGWMELDRPNRHAPLRPDGRSARALQGGRPVTFRSRLMIDVRRPGRWTTVQDRGRLGFERYGIPTGGAVDCFAASVANRLVGNHPDAALLECTARGPDLRFREDYL